MKNSLQEQLNRVCLGIDGALYNKPILKKLEKFGYNETQLWQGKALCERVRMLETAKTDGLGGQKDRTQAFQEAREAIQERYSYHIAVAKLALRNERSWWDTLQLTGKRKTNVAEWLGQMQSFYQNITRVAPQMRKQGVTTEELQQTAEMVAAATDLRVQQASKRSETQSATQQRRAAMDELTAWMQDFRYLAKYALKDDPQQLEALGMMARVA